MSTETTQNCGCGQDSPKSEPIIMTKVEPTVLSRIMDKVFVSESEKNSRMEICRACEHFSPALTQCGICGCFLEAKTRLKGFHCALPDIGGEAKW